MTDDPGLTPGFVHRGDSRPMSDYYEGPRDPTAPHWCCLQDVVVSRHELTVETDCLLHGRKKGGNND